MERKEVHFDIRTNQETVITKTVPDEEVLSMQRDVKNKQILQFKQNLANTDYQAIKYSEGELTAEEYEPIKQQRREWRAEINRLESEVQDVNL